jgi:DNA repair exonuclease SbcCD nuclease subunit
MKILLFADLHLHQYQQFAEPTPTGRNSRLQHGLDVIAQAADICREHSVDVCIFAGDLMHSWRTVDVESYTAAWGALFHLADECSYLVLLAGNHDQYDRPGTITTLSPMHLFASIEDTPRVTAFEDFDRGVISIAFCPFTADEDRFRMFSRNLPTTGVDFFVFHQPIKQALLPGTNLELGKGVDLQDLPLDKVRLCIGGDIHRRQWLGSKCLYLGSPLQLDFSDVGQQKGFTLIDTTDWIPTLIESNAPKFYSYGTAAEFIGVFTSTRCPDPSKDFLRVTCRTKEEAREIKQTWPRVQVLMEREDQHPEQRMKPDLSDQQVIAEYAQRFHGELEPRRLTREGLAYLDPNTTGDRQDG